MSNTSIQRRQHQPLQTQAAPERMDQWSYYTPLVDIVETNDAFLFQADLPGVRAEDLDISYQNGVLTLDAKVQPRQPQETRFVWREYGVGHFHRSFSIDTPIDVDGIRAELAQGVLSLFVPKAEHAKARKIKIEAS